jgi:rhodanese-related sulfurtransferase
MLETPTLSPSQAREFFTRKVSFTTGPVEVSHLIDESENVNIIDVREPEDFKKGHVPGALNLPKVQWETESCLRKDAVNILYCYTQTCHLAAQAAARFAGDGFQVMEMEGGFEAWQHNELPVEK